MRNPIQNESQISPLGIFLAQITLWSPTANPELFNFLDYFQAVADFAFRIERLEEI